MNKEISLEQAIDKVHDGASIMLGGFLGIGMPLRLIEMLAQKGLKDLTIISLVSSNPPGGFDLSVLFDNRQVKRYITSHIGTSPQVQRAYNEGEIELELSPLGTLIERIRCGGFGLGGALTPVGIGTVAEEGKQKITVNGKEYLLETPLRADFAFIKGHKADRMGNVMYRSCSINSNTTMASAADITIAEVNEVVEVGQLDPMLVGTPAIFVNHVAVGNTLQEQEEVIGKRWHDTNRFA